MLDLKTIDPLRDFLVNTLKSSRMNALGKSVANGGLSDGDLTNILKYLTTVRDGEVLVGGTPTTGLSGSGTFSTPVFAEELSSETLTLKVSNARNAQITSITLDGGVGSTLPFRIFSQTCNVTLTAATAPGTNAPECEIQVKFMPPPGSMANSVTTAVGMLTLSFAGVQSPASVAHKITLSGTSAGPRPMNSPTFTPVGFNALTSFSAPPTGSQTLCPTIQNLNGTADLSLSFSVVKAAGSGADYSNYFELGDTANCPVTPTPTPSACNNILPANATCALALRFNPAKFRDAASDIAARSATLRVNHNAPANSVAEFPMTGNLTIAPLPPVVGGTPGTPLPPVVGGTPAFLTASAAGLSLGSVRVGAQSTPVELRLASAGNGVVQVTGMEAGAPFTVHSKTCPSPPFTLLSGSDCTVTVTFTPTDARAATATLRISTDANTKALEVPLAGNGEEKADVSSGGCSMASGDTLADPTLWTLVLLAIAALAYRRRTRAALRQRP